MSIAPPTPHARRPRRSSPPARRRPARPWREWRWSTACRARPAAQLGRLHSWAHLPSPTGEGVGAGGGRPHSLTRRASPAPFSPREKGKRTVLRKGDPARFAASLQPADDALAQTREAAVPAAGIEDDLGVIERRAEHRGLRDLAAIAAADASVVHGGDRIVLERGVGVLQRQRRAARETDASGGTRADGLVDAETLLHHA